MLGNKGKLFLPFLSCKMPSPLSSHFLCSSSSIFLVLVLLALFPSSASASADDTSSLYLVHVARSERPSPFADDSQWFASALAESRGLDLHGDYDADLHGPLYTYSSVFHGFAAKLTSREAEALKKVGGVLSVLPDQAACRLHTTRTPQFLGLNTSSGPWPDSRFGHDVIVGVMDSGVWPERRSFGDAGLGPVPARWRGECEPGPGFDDPAALCNRKLIGARAFYKGYEAASGPINASDEYRSARDSQGHGSHTASTAAGAHVRRAGLLGSAPGDARGMAPAARLAAYKVCWKGGCFNSDLLAAFERAILDGVDIVSLSIGGGVLPYFLDPIAIGSFAAVERGILVTTSAGNAGPSPQSITNVAPWLLTVAASTLDRDFPATVKLPHHAASYRGVSLYDGQELGDRQIPLVYAGDVGLPGSNGSANLCMQGTLDPAKVKGKIVLCDRGISARASKGMVVKEAGGTGMILANAQMNGEELIADSHVLPATLVGYEAGVVIKNYITRSANTNPPTASIIFSGTVLGVRPAPVMAAFSSRGPNPANPEILKPDITAPGVNILAAWTSKIGPTELPGDDRVVEFNIMSGTSMSCPHVTGLSALVKAAHPSWSPAAVKSALMTTAFNIDNTGSLLLDGSDSNMSTPFSFGSGHVDPVKALDPGLVYDLHTQDYVDFLCGLNYSDTWLALFTKGHYNCSRETKTPGNLNYPSLSFVYNQDGNTSRYSSTITRVVTNVGRGESTYSVSATPPPGVAMEIEPTTLSFTRLYERKAYRVTCKTSSKRMGPGESDSTFGSLVWSDGMHNVHSPIVFTWQNNLL